MDSAEKGRMISNWVRKNLHRHGDSYVAGIFFFVNDDPRLLKEELDLIKYSLDQAIMRRGCGRHIIPSEDVARQQIATLFKYQQKLPKILRRFRFLFFQRKINEHESWDVL